jgi:hypothetical protein
MEKSFIIKTETSPITVSATCMYFAIKKHMIERIELMLNAMALRQVIKDLRRNEEACLIDCLVRNWHSSDER